MSSSLVVLFLLDQLGQLEAISANMLEMDYQNIALADDWNDFGIRRIKKGEITIPSTPRPRRIDPPQPTKEEYFPISRTRGLKSIGKVLVYNSTVEKKVEVQVVQIRNIKRIGGQYPYGPRNGTVVELKEPIFVVRRMLSEVVEPSYWEKFQKARGSPTAPSDHISRSSLSLLLRLLGSTNGS